MSLDNAVTKLQNASYSWAKKYVEAQNDLNYIRDFWNSMIHLQNSSFYQGSIPEWSTVKSAFKDTYHDLLKNYRNGNSKNHRINSLLLLQETSLILIENDYKFKYISDN